jgi:putative salt-induced outer membrane protein YdiY
VGHSRNLTKRLFFNGFNDWEYDRFQALDLRVTLGGGLGFNVWKGERGRLDLPFGAAWSHSKFDPVPRPSFTRNAAEAYWGDDLTFKLSSRTSLTQSCRMFNNLSDTGQYRVNFDLGASTQVVKWLSWNLSVSDRYLSNPAPGRKTNDLLYTTGLGINFAH